MTRAAVVAAILALLSAGSGGAWADVNVSLGGLTLAPLPGMTVTVDTATLEDGTRVRFDKPAEERRLLALQGVPEGNPEGARALQLDYRLEMMHGEAPRLALVVFDGRGGSWYRVAGRPLAVGETRTARLSATNLRPTAFSRVDATEPDWSDIERVWVGAVIDGSAQGVLELAGARLTDEPYVPTAPVRVTGEGVGRWSLSHDSAMKATLTTPNEGPDGRQCMKTEFTTPTGAHMYLLPGVVVVEPELEGYTSLRFLYHSGLPPDMRMLVQLTERSGAIYYVERTGPWPDEWRVMTIPFEEFRAASWGPRDPNEQLDIEDIRSVTIGSHGTPRQTEGFIMATDIEFVP